MVTATTDATASPPATVADPLGPWPALVLPPPPSVDAFIPHAELADLRAKAEEMADRVLAVRAEVAKLEDELSEIPGRMDVLAEEERSTGESREDALLELSARRGVLEARAKAARAAAERVRAEVDAPLRETFEAARRLEHDALYRAAVAASEQANAVYRLVAETQRIANARIAAVHAWVQPLMKSNPFGPLADYTPSSNGTWTWDSLAALQRQFAPGTIQREIKHALGETGR